MIDIEKRAEELMLKAMEGHTPRTQPLQVYERALKAVAAALTPPEGYVLVPVEPTEAMIAEAWKYGSADDAPDPVYSYRAMLAARPEVPGG
ncbi:hypothetical protein ACTT2I_05265 [Stenotrophomonas sp. PUT21]|uniref:hypothetical protein n=1 Tax=Stenotrophomonas sp. PUT21 TaxID=3456954 RepID=UPI003FCC5352